MDEYNGLPYSKNIWRPSWSWYSTLSKKVIFFFLSQPQRDQVPGESLTCFSLTGSRLLCRTHVLKGWAVWMCVDCFLPPLGCWPVDLEEILSHWNHSWIYNLLELHVLLASSHRASCSLAFCIRSLVPRCCWDTIPGAWDCRVALSGPPFHFYARWAVLDLSEIFSAPLHYSLWAS